MIESCKYLKGNKMKIPELFEYNMKDILKEEYNDFIDQYNLESFSGLRVNTLKISVEEFKKIYSNITGKVNWTDDGFYTKSDSTPSLSPLYNAGLFYIQEPSAMFPVYASQIKKGDKVLDLCSAPGGKTIQAAAYVGEEGLIVSNDISGSRLKAVVKNTEMYGIKNSIIINEDVKRIVKYVDEYFDVVLVDAPCSGEGMFRRDPKVLANYDEFNPNYCSNIQRDILSHVGKLVRAGGKIVYSTCTFNKLENEESIEYFLANNKEFKLSMARRKDEISPGLGKYKNACRLWPHRLKGEGHFTCVLVKDGEEKHQESNLKYNKPPIEYADFEKKNLNLVLEGYFYQKGNSLYITKNKFNGLDKLKVIKNGVYLGDVKKGRFIPSHNLAMILMRADFKIVHELKVDDIDTIKYLKGETLYSPGENGFLAVLVEGYILGFGKRVDNQIKNLYPKGWRRLK